LQGQCCLFPAKRKVQLILENPLHTKVVQHVQQSRGTLASVTYLPCICHITVTLGKVWLNPKCFFIFRHAHIKIVQLRNTSSSTQFTRKQQIITKHYKYEAKQITDRIETKAEITIHKPGNKLHQGAVNYRCEADFSHRQCYYVLTLSYNFHSCTFDVQESNANLHQLHKYEINEFTGNQNYSPRKYENNKLKIDNKKYSILKIS